MSFLQLEGVTKSYPGVQAVTGFDLSVTEGEIVTLLGPSGCGKTTLLRVIAGLEAPDAGRILVEDRDITAIPPHQRGIGLMFQDFALFPHMKVFDNVAFGLQMQNLPPDQMRDKVRVTLALVGLSGFEGRDVNDLSGGEQQRVALARSLAPNPRLLMLDEPLGSLDRTLRERLMNELRAILKRVGVTALYVTHDQQEAFALSDRVVIMRAGRRVQAGEPEAVYHAPADEWVARFLGLTNLLSGRVTGRDGDCLRLDTEIGPLSATLNARQPPVGQHVTVLVHPEGARLERDALPGDNVLRGTITRRSFRGGVYLLDVKSDEGPTLTFHVSAVGQTIPPTGEPVSLHLAPQAITLWTERTS